MWRARITLFFGVLVAAGSFAALIVLNRSDYANSYGRDPFAVVSNKSPGCKIERTTLEVQPPTEFLHNKQDWLTTLYVRSNCDKIVMRVPWKIEEGGALASDPGCRWSLRNFEEPQPEKDNDGEQIVHRFVESTVAPSAQQCQHILTFNGKFDRLNWFTNRLVIGFPYGVDPPSVAGTDFDASIRLMNVFSHSGVRNYEVRLTNRDKEGQLQVANIAISTLLGVGVAAIFEALLLLTAVSMIDSRIRDHFNDPQQR